jgi:hypothetical protein
MITQNRWICDNTFIQTSEDLSIRIFDIRAKPFKPQLEVKVGTNFATTCDLFSTGELFSTGHRGFNGSGSDVMLWSLKKLDEPLFTFTDHQFTPETVRFLDHNKPTIASAAKDA